MPTGKGQSAGGKDRSATRTGRQQGLVGSKDWSAARTGRRQGLAGRVAAGQNPNRAGKADHALSHQSGVLATAAFETGLARAVAGVVIRSAVIAVFAGEHQAGG
jgi:hypothetical protein